MSVSIDPNPRYAVLPPKPPAEDIWLEVCWKLTRPRYELCEFDLNAHIHQRLIVAEVIRREWDSRFKIKSLNRQASREIKAEGAVAHGLLQLISKVHLRSPARLWHIHPAKWFEALMLEREAIGVMQLGPFTKTDFLKKLRKENQDLFTLAGNPFTAKYTVHLFDAVLELSERYDQFAKALRGYVTARRKMVTLIDNQKSAFYIKRADGSRKKLRQGRKKVDLETLSQQ